MSYIERTLWYDQGDGLTQLTERDLTARREPLVILGEPGMGKTCLLERLGERVGYARCTAAQLWGRHVPQTLLGDADVLVIDGLDQLSARAEGDAIDQVLNKLGQMGYPRFVLSCRVADWRSATGREAIRGQYAEPPLELHLEPLADGDVVTYLAARHGPSSAKAVVEHFRERGLSGLLGNPQTLQMIASIASQADLPDSRAQLFERAIDLMRVEHNEKRADAQLAGETVLNAAGAAFASLILTGNEVIVRNAAANVAEGELQLVDVSLLPDGASIRDALGTRLFKAEGPNRFTYWHRRIGEFLGARWLAKQADTSRKKRRLLSLFHAYGLVPVSLRGMHAWLAREPGLILDVIAADPMGVIEYGETDDLTVEQARRLLLALEKHAANNPSIFTWERYPARGLARSELKDELQRLILAPETAFGLRMLVLESIKGARVAVDLADDLLAHFLDSAADFASRRAASEALGDLCPGQDWQGVMATLRDQDDHLSLRLALEVMVTRGNGHFSDQLIAEVGTFYAVTGTDDVGMLDELVNSLHKSRLTGVLDCLTGVAKRLGPPQTKSAKATVCDFAYALLARVTESDELVPERLWGWMEPFEEAIGYQTGSREQLAQTMRGRVSLRRAIQRYVMDDPASHMSIRERVNELSRRCTALTPTPDDVIVLLSRWDPADRRDERWRELLMLVWHDGEDGAAVRAAARPFAAHRADLVEWVNRLATPQPATWQIRQQALKRKRRARRAMALSDERKDYRARLDALIAGDGEALLAPAIAYLGRFAALREATPQHWLTEWLGSEIAEATVRGFETFLIKPSQSGAREVAIAFARSGHWGTTHVAVAGLAERFQKGVNFDDLTDDQLMGAYFPLRRSRLDANAGVPGLEEAVSTAIDRRGLWGEAMRLYHEPQLEERQHHVEGLYALMRDDARQQLGVELAFEWLQRFADLHHTVEAELLDRLMSAGRLEELRRLVVDRVASTDCERRRNWDAIGLLVDFERMVNHVDGSPIERQLLWHIRDRAGERKGSRAGLELATAQLEWIVGAFRVLWPAAERPSGTTTGNVNPWDASEFLRRMMSSLGNKSDEDAVAAMHRLLDAPRDGYTDYLRSVAAEQARIRVEAAYSPPTVESIDVIVRERPPINVEDLQTVMMEELKIVQAKVVSDDAESWRGFYDDNGVPYDEERCRDHLLNLLRQGSDGIALEPETHSGGDREVDITCTVREIRLPIEIKGQWHRELWKAADEQLAKHYVRDWRADGRGIYLVLWFGEQRQKGKTLTRPPRGLKSPATADRLREMLEAESRAAADGRVVIAVLDLDREFNVGQSVTQGNVAHPSGN